MTNEHESAAVGCEKFQASLAERFAKDEKEVYRDPHLKTCSLCRAMVMDLEKIAEAAREIFEQGN